MINDFSCYVYDVIDLGGLDRSAGVLLFYTVHARCGHMIAFFFKCHGLLISKKIRDNDL